jgi:hypothetical protein
LANYLQSGLDKVNEQSNITLKNVETAAATLSSTY